MPPMPTGTDENMDQSGFCHKTAAQENALFSLILSEKKKKKKKNLKQNAL
jgi:hypothetical protein